MYLVLGTILLLLTGAAAHGQEQKVTIERTDTSCVVREGERLIFEYRFGEVTHKPYVAGLHSPSGINILHDSPADHVHHHGLMFAIKVNSVNFWEEAAGAGKQIDRGLAHMKSTTEDSRLGICQHLTWKNHDGRALAYETRRIRVTPPQGASVTFLEWSTVLKNVGSKPDQLSGNHYHGLGMRFPEWMDKSARYIFPEDSAKPETVRGTEQLTRSRWCAVMGKTEQGKPITVALFSHPKNPRHPHHFFTMTQPFAYLSATMNLHREAMPLESDKPLVLKYAIAAWDGEMDRPQIEKLYAVWAK